MHMAILIGHAACVSKYPCCAFLSFLNIFLTLFIFFSKIAHSYFTGMEKVRRYYIKPAGCRIYSSQSHKEKFRSVHERRSTIERIVFT